jgi:hypothetical protein
MWLIARYAASSLFSLRPALSTASGAQSLLAPTPFAIKMALLDAALRRFGVAAGQQWWPAIRALDIALDLPDLIVVNKTFIKIQRPTRVTKSDAEEVAAAKAAGVYPMGPTIAFREFVQFGGPIGIALRQPATHGEPPLPDLLAQINYFGKRGSFFQLQALPETVDDLDRRWTLITAPTAGFPINGTLQMLDDCGTGLTWDHVNVYSSKRIALGKNERILRPIVLPHQLRRSSYRYSLYERIG